jgi:hypothetical protein
MSVKDKLEIGLVKDAATRCDNLPDFQKDEELCPPPTKGAGRSRPSGAAEGGETRQPPVQQPPARRPTRRPTRG